MRLKIKFRIQINRNKDIFLLNLYILQPLLKLIEKLFKLHLVTDAIDTRNVIMIQKLLKIGFELFFSLLKIDLFIYLFC